MPAGKTRSQLWSGVPLIAFSSRGVGNGEPIDGPSAYGDDAEPLSGTPGFRKSTLVHTIRNINESPPGCLTGIAQRFVTPHDPPHRRMETIGADQHVGHDHLTIAKRHSHTVRKPVVTENRSAYFDTTTHTCMQRRLQISTFQRNTAAGHVTYLSAQEYLPRAVTDAGKSQLVAYRSHRRVQTNVRQRLKGVRRHCNAGADQPQLHGALYDTERPARPS